MPWFVGAVRESLQGFRRHCRVQGRVCAVVFGLARRVRPDIYKKTAVGTLRRGVPAPCRRGTAASPSDGFVAPAQSVPPLNSAGTAQRAIPTFVSSLPAETVMKYPGYSEDEFDLPSKHTNLRHENSELVGIVWRC